MSASTCCPCLLVSTSLQASMHIGQIGDLMFVCHFCIFSSVYIGGEVGVGSARTPPSRERGAESHFRRGEPNQLLCTTTATTTRRESNYYVLLLVQLLGESPTRGGEPPIKGTSPHHPAPPAFLRIEYLRLNKKEDLCNLNKSIVPAI